MATSTQRQRLLDIVAAALLAVDGRQCVARALHARAPINGDICLAAIGKAARAMTEGAIDVVGQQIRAGLVITKPMDAALELPEVVQLRLADHPIPGRRSLDAGEALLAFVRSCSARDTLLFLISGGASSLVEVLPPHIDLDNLQKINRWLLGSGYNIRQINALRQRISCIKAGRLANFIRSQRVVSLMMSDVEGNDQRIIGSGLLTASPAVDMSSFHLPAWVLALIDDDPDRPSAEASVFDRIEQGIVADLGQALRAAEATAARLGYVVYNHGSVLYGEAGQRGMEIGKYLLEAPVGVHLWGGETTVTLPATIGSGGRNLQFALAAAKTLAGESAIILAALASDGDDGNSGVAGAIVDGATLARACASIDEVNDALLRADAKGLLQRGRALQSLAKGRSNVADIVIAIKGD